MAVFKPARFLSWANTSLNEAVVLVPPQAHHHHLTPAQWQRSRTTSLRLDTAPPPPFHLSEATTPRSSRSSRGFALGWAVEQRYWLSCLPVLPQLAVGQ